MKRMFKMFRSKAASCKTLGDEDNPFKTYSDRRMDSFAKRACPRCRGSLERTECGVDGFWLMCSRCYKLYGGADAESVLEAIFDERLSIAIEKADKAAALDPKNIARTYADGRKAIHKRKSWRAR